MRLLKLGLAGAVLVGAALGLLLITDVLPADQIGTMAGWAFGGLVVVVLAAMLLGGLRGDAARRDASDQPVP
jgi:hypothetical protein